MNVQRPNEEGEKDGDYEKYNVDAYFDKVTKKHFHEMRLKYVIYI